MTGRILILQSFLDYLRLMTTIRRVDNGVSWDSSRGHSAALLTLIVGAIGGFVRTQGWVRHQQCPILRGCVALKSRRLASQFVLLTNPRDVASIPYFYRDIDVSVASTQECEVLIIERSDALPRDGTADWIWPDEQMRVRIWEKPLRGSTPMRAHT